MRITIFAETEIIMNYETLQKFLDANPSNAIFLENLIRENICQQSRIISRYLSIIFALSILFLVIQDDKEFNASAFGVSLSGLIIKKNAIPIVLSVLFLFYLKAISFRKDLENSYRYVFTINHGISITYDFYKPNWLDEVTRLVLPFRSVSELVRFDGPKWLKIAKLIIAGIPALTALFLPVYIVQKAFFSLVYISDKHIFDYLTITFLGTGFLCALFYFFDYYDKVIDRFSRKPNN